MTFYKRNPLHKKKPLNLSEAKKKLMDFVARRDHTEKELRQKLSARCEPEVVEKTLAWAHEQNWLAAPEKLKTQFAEQLGRRGKGILKINQKLKDLGLDVVKSDKTSELKKAKKLVLAKWSTDDFNALDYKESQKLKAKIIRFLITRGYESEIINLILKTEFKKTSHSNVSQAATDSNANDTYEDDTYDEEF